MADRDTNSRDNPASAERPDDSAGIDFLDFLFTFVLTFGLVPEALGIGDVSGPLSEGWFAPGHLWSIADLEKITALLLGLLTLTLSWFGYHASIRGQALDFGKVSGLFRFQIDVLLVLLYGLMLINYGNFAFVLKSAVVVFVLFVVWDLFKAREMGDRYLRPSDLNGRPRPNYRREFVTVVWTIAMILVLVLHFNAVRYILLWGGIAIFISVVYRVHKIKPWRSLERRFGVRTWEAPRRST